MPLRAAPRRLRPQHLRSLDHPHIAIRSAEALLAAPEWTTSSPRIASIRRPRVCVRTGARSSSADSAAAPATLDQPSVTASAT